MIARLIILVALVLGLLLGGVALGAWLFGDTKAVEAQGGDQDWEMVQRNIAGAAAGGQSISSGLLRESDMFLYNKRTGKAYKYFPGCTSGQVQSDQGCFFAIPVLASGQASQVLPTPQSRSPGSTH